MHIIVIHTKTQILKRKILLFIINYFRTQMSYQKLIEIVQI